MQEACREAQVPWNCTWALNQQKREARATSAGRSRAGGTLGDSWKERLVLQWVGDFKKLFASG